MAVTDPVDARLLAALAELGKVAVHELANKVGMDPREVAYRLVSLSGSGLPLLVGVESDPQGLRAALAPPAHGTPSGPYPAAPSTPAPQQAIPSGPYPPPPTRAQPAPPPQPPSAPGPGPGPGQPSAQPAPNPAPTSAPASNPWGPPQTSQWARADPQPTNPANEASGSDVRTGRIGDTLETEGLEGGRVSVQLLEVQDPADFLFGAAGYRLEAGERAVVVHTEITNRASTPFESLPDNYLELLTADDATITKAPISLSSRPPHRIGVRPGETTGGHTVYVLANTTKIVSVRWSPRPEADARSLTWSIGD